MNRRDAVKTTALLLGTAALACDRPAPAPPSSGTLSVDDQSLAESIADTLLPTTAASPGAKAAGAGAAMHLLLTDCYDAATQQRIVRGLREFRRACHERCAAEFTSLSSADRERFLKQIDAEAQQQGDAHYFHLVRELTHRAYFSSEIGMTQARRYIRVPGRWVGCVPRAENQPAWA